MNAPETAPVSTHAQGDYVLMTDAAGIYGVSEATLYRMARRGQVRFYRRPGDKRNWLLAAEADAVLRMRPVTAQNNASA